MHCRLKHTSEVLLRLSSCGQLLLMLKFTSAAGVDSYVEWQAVSSNLFIQQA